MYKSDILNSNGSINLDNVIYALNNHEDKLNTLEDEKKFQKKSFNAQNLLNLMTSVSNSSRIIFGEFFGDNLTSGSTYNGTIAKLYKATGKYPSFIGSDYNSSSLLNTVQMSNVNAHLIEYWNNGGFAQFTCSLRNPWTNGGRNDLANVKLSDLVDSTTAAYAVFIGWLDRIAVGLQELRDNDVPVLWRPFHEMNGNWFWWGFLNGVADKSGFVNMWRFMHDYFTNVKGLNNLIWVFSCQSYTSDASGWCKPVDYYYPGDDYVDVVGLDSYISGSDNFNFRGAYDSYRILTELGKPFGFCEAGTSGVINGTWDNMKYLDIKKYFPKCCYFMTWCDWSGSTQQVEENLNAKQMMNDTRIITRDKLFVQPKSSIVSTSPKAFDLFPQPVIAVGQNKLFNSYNGNALNIRRSSDNTTSDIGFYSMGNRNDTTISNFVGSNSAYVTTLYDQCGYGVNFSQATVASQPLLVNSGTINSGMYFDGVDDVLVGTSNANTAFTSGNFTIGFKFNMDNSIAGGACLFSKGQTSSQPDQFALTYNASSKQFQLWVNGTLLGNTNMPSSLYNTLDGTSCTVTTGIDHTFIITYDGSYMKCYLDGFVIINTSFKIGAINYQNILLGADPGSSLTTYRSFFKGNIYWFGAWNCKLEEYQIVTLSRQ